ncbi:5-methylcytosine-specific restriction endonuclease McrA [Isoptericola halotolerans]|uniref:5-methylcytosine-specific restriction endonuclease McrA n=1 Tax=Isoptericola halotolerans TaxID=300560 RepID=A0ABX2A8G1_9MICO|nr:5-methylcytosine-specific restriction endonuclease McrA [Isoptericola halotolerans]
MVELRGPYCRECSNRRAAEWKRKNPRDRVTKYLDARRARVLGAEFEVFDRVEIFERDGWVCGICDEPVDRGIAWPDPMSPSLDRVVPIARGGSHTRANTQCSHLTCNTAKGAREEVA